MSTLSSDAPWSLAGKTALVTGGSRGIGRAIATHLSRKGVSKLAITYSSNAKEAEITLEKCRALGVQQAVAVQADTLDPEFGRKTISQVLKGLDTKVIDILVNNAILGDVSKVVPATDVNLSNFLEVMQGNVFGPVSLTTALLPHLPTYGGRVISISSTAAYIPNYDATMTYGASKSALQSFTRSFADAFGKQKQATFNSVVVGLTETDAVRNAMPLFPPGFVETNIQESTAAERLGVPDDIAYIVGFLASEEARWVNGAAISANGGNKYGIAALG